MRKSLNLQHQALAWRAVACVAIVLLLVSTLVLRGNSARAESPVFPTPSTVGVPESWAPTTEHRGDLRVSQPGAVISDIRILDGDLRVEAPNVTIRRTEVVGGRIVNEFGGQCSPGLLIEDSTLRASTQASATDGRPAVSSGGYIARRVKIDGLPEGFRVGGRTSPGCGPVTIEDSFARIVAPAVCRSWGGDGIQAYGGSNLQIRNVTLELVERPDCGGNAPFFVPAEQGNSPVAIDGLLVIGGGYSFRLGVPASVKGLRIAEGSWYYGPIDVDCAALDSWEARIVAVDSYAVSSDGAPQRCGSWSGGPSSEGSAQTRPPETPSTPTDASMTTAAVPTIGITAPKSGAVIRGYAIFRASVGAEVVGVTFLVDGVPVGKEDVVAPYAAWWNSRSVTSGPHTIEVIARDSDGRTAEAAVEVFVRSRNGWPGTDSTSPSATSTTVLAPTTTSRPATSSTLATTSTRPSTSTTAMSTTTTGAPSTTTTPPPATTVTSTSVGGFPDALTTGPHGELAPYTGPCTVTADGAIIENVVVGCATLTIRARDVVVRNAKTGSIYLSESDMRSSVLIEDVLVDAGTAVPGGSTGISGPNLTVRRVEVVGGNRSIYCHRFCLIEDSYLHGQSIPANSDYHASGFRASQDVVFRHNTVVCDVRDTPAGGGCSASITMYGDFDPVQRVSIINNYLPGTEGGFCAYGGSSGVGTKPYAGDARDIVFADNVFGPGENGKCGNWGPITDFDPRRPGNTWRNNAWTDGRPVSVNG